MSFMPGQASTEGERPFVNIFIASDRGSNRPHAGIFSHRNFLPIMCDLQSSKKVDMFCNLII